MWAVAWAGACGQWIGRHPQWDQPLVHGPRQRERAGARRTAHARRRKCRRRDAGGPPL